MILGDKAVQWFQVDPYPEEESRGLEEVNIPQKNQIRNRKGSQSPGLMASLVRVEKGLSGQPQCPHQELGAGPRAGHCIRPCWAPPGLTPHVLVPHVGTATTSPGLKMTLSYISGFRGSAVKCPAGASCVLLRPSPFQRNPRGPVMGRGR